MDQSADAEGKATKWVYGISIGIVIVAAAFVGVAYVLNAEMDKKVQEAKIRQLEAYARLPELPLRVTYRKAMMGPGLVIVFTNSSERALAVSARFRNPTLNTEKTFRVDVPPSGAKEVGHLEGWTFSSGDTIDVTHAEYKSAAIKIP